jgi:hypothetical protein
MLRKLAVLGLLTVSCVSEAGAHSGGLDQSGCHHDRKRGGYHCHRAQQRFIAPTPRKSVPQAAPLLQAPSPAPSTGRTKAERLASEVQQALSALGYYEGPITGTVGPKTKKSIAEFEKAFALPITGRISPDLLRRLGIAWP